jgi:aryl-alcohol dehydrogenase-like predicted oxidoreductase
MRDGRAFETLSANFELNRALRPLAEHHRGRPGTVAITWTLEDEGVSAAIGGTRNVAQLEGRIALASFELDVENLVQARHALEKTGAGKGPIS